MLRALVKLLICWNPKRRQDDDHQARGLCLRRIAGSERHLITVASDGASAGMTASEYLALEKVKGGEMFEGAKNGKYANEYVAMLS